MTWAWVAICLLGWGTGLRLTCSLAKSTRKRRIGWFCLNFSFLFFRKVLIYYHNTFSLALFSCLSYPFTLVHRKVLLTLSVQQKAETFVFVIALLIFSLKMPRKLRFHEQKLLKKLDFISWEVDGNLHEVKVMRKYHIQRREDYTKWVIIWQLDSNGWLVDWLQFCQMVKSAVHCEFLLFQV